MRRVTLPALALVLGCGSGAPRVGSPGSAVGEAAGGWIAFETRRGGSIRVMAVR